MDPSRRSGGATWLRDAPKSTHTWRNTHPYGEIRYFLKEIILDRDLA